MMLAAITSGLCLAIALPLAASAWMRKRSADRMLASLSEIPVGARIVVLGCPARSPSGEPNLYFVARIAAAAAAYQHAESQVGTSRGDGVRLLCSGWDGQGEATELALALIEAGVASERIRVDGKAARTIDSIEHVAAHHRSERIVFVSQAFHLPRVLYLSRNHGIDAWGLRAEGTLRGMRPRLREPLARLRAIVDLQLRGPRR